MNDEQRKLSLDTWSDPDFGDEFDFKIERGFLEQGRSFSSEALEELSDAMTVFVDSRVLARWRKTNEPPTALTVHVNVHVG